MIKSVKAMAVAALVAVAPFGAHAQNGEGAIEEVLVILSSESLQTQGMQWSWPIPWPNKAPR